jgi:hypothetical protein
MAPPVLDYEAGKRILPELITITLTRPLSLAGPAQSITVANVQEQAGREEDVDSPLGGALSGTRRVFHLFASECAALPPDQDFEITKADGTVWVIKTVDILAHFHRYRCQTLRKN